MEQVPRVSKSCDRSCHSDVAQIGKKWLGGDNLPTCETAVTLRVLRNLRSLATKAEGAAAVALVKLVR